MRHTKHTHTQIQPHKHTFSCITSRLKAYWCFSFLYSLIACLQFSLHSHTQTQTLFRPFLIKASTDCRHTVTRHQIYELCGRVDSIGWELIDKIYTLHSHSPVRKICIQHWSHPETPQSALIITRILHTYTRTHTLNVRTQVHFSFLFKLPFFCYAQPP